MRQITYILLLAVGIPITLFSFWGFLLTMGGTTDAVIYALVFFATLALGLVLSGMGVAGFLQSRVFPMAPKSIRETGERPQSKGIFLLFYLVFFYPVGVYYFWTQREYFKYKLHIVFLILGLWKLLVSILLFVFYLFPAVEDVGVRVPILFNIAWIALIIFVFVEIAFGLFTRRQIQKGVEIEQNYLTISLALLIIYPILLMVSGLLIKISV